jgi:hypothetical protein
LEFGAVVVEQMRSILIQSEFQGMPVDDEVENILKL